LERLPAAAPGHRSSVGWISILGWAALALGFASALAILVDELALGHRAPMPIMDVVHPVTALYLGPAWLWVYFGRRRAPVALAVSHCGAGCTLGDIGGEWILFALGSEAFGWELGLDLALAWSLGVVFQYLTIGDLGRAVRADTLSILAFEVGLFGWMALTHYVLFQPPLAIDTSGHWLMMQLGMVAGFGTAWPANAWLIRRGVKEAMG
jgi:Domain of unknown function (DUF4396)